MNSSSTNNGPTYYEILDVALLATQAEIRRAYLKQSLKYHPDKNPENPEEAKEQFILVGQAYDTLSDPGKRKSYDREILSGRSPLRFNNSNSNNERTYESYRKAFDERMANLSEDELSALKNIASIVGSVFGAVYGSRLGRKFGGNSRVGRAIGDSAGTLMGSLTGSQVGTTLVQNFHNNSVDRVTYEEKKRFARERGESAPEPSQGNNVNWKDFAPKSDQSLNAMMRGTKQGVAAGSNPTYCGSKPSGPNWNKRIEIGEKLFGAVKRLSDASKNR